MALASSRFFLPVSRELLQPLPGERAGDLFERIGVPKSPGYRVVSFYEAHAAVSSQPSGLKSDGRQVLRLAGGLRADRALPDRAIIKGPSLKQALQTLNDVGVRYCLGFQSAANQISYFEPSGHHAIYLSAKANAETQAMKADKIAMGEIVNAFTQHPEASREHRYDFFIDDLQRLDVRRDQDGTPHTSHTQTLFDLATHARMAASFEFLYELKFRAETR